MTLQDLIDLLQTTVAAYLGVGALIAVAMLTKLPPGRIDWPRFCLNFALWPRMIKGELL